MGGTVETIDGFETGNTVATNYRASPSQVAPQPQAGEPVEKPYAYEFGRSNGDDTFSVFIERSLPAKPHPDWPVKPLYASPQAANPVQVTDAMVEAVVSWVCDDVLPAYDIPSDVPRNDPELPDSCRSTLTATIGAGGQAVAWQWRYKYDDGKWGDWWNERRADADALLQENVLIAEESRPLYAHPPHPADERVVEALIDKVLDAAGKYMGAQYGNTALHHPTDRARIKAALATKECRKDG